jgi:hypothetical protein
MALLGALLCLLETIRRPPPSHTPFLSRNPLGLRTSTERRRDSGGYLVCDRDDHVAYVLQTLGYSRRCR